MKKIGLTGGIACGKSTFVEMLIENKFKVIDSDKIVRDILENDREISLYIEENFSPSFILNGKILRKEFGEYIFSHEKERIKYEEFIMPKIFKKIDDEFSFYEKNGEKICILDAPLLIEKKLHEKMDYVILIWANKEVQLQRLIKRDNISKESAMLRINAQMDIDIKIRFADFVIDNSKGREYLKEQIIHLCSILETL